MKLRLTVGAFRNIIVAFRGLCAPCGCPNLLYALNIVRRPVKSSFHCNHSLIACFQHSNHLGPLSEEWKHVSQVKPISYFSLYYFLVDILLPLLVCFCVFVFARVCVCADADTRNSPNNWLQHWKVQELKVELYRIIIMHIYSFMTGLHSFNEKWQMHRKVSSWAVLSPSSSLFFCMQHVFYSLWYVRTEQI